MVRENHYSKDTIKKRVFFIGTNFVTPDKFRTNDIFRKKNTHPDSIEVLITKVWARSIVSCWKKKKNSKFSVAKGGGGRAGSLNLKHFTPKTNTFLYQIKIYLLKISSEVSKVRRGEGVTASPPRLRHYTLRRFVQRFCRKFE